MSEPFLGEIRMVGFTFNPQGWAQCNGQLLSISSNTALFALLGTTYGGDGQTTFGLPNLRGRAPIHVGQSPGTSNFVQGEIAGSENVTLSLNQMPSHNHSLGANTAGNHTSPAGNFPGNEDSPIKIYATSANATMSAGAIGVAGGNLPFSVLQPVLCVMFIIALQGIFPSRN